MKIDLVWEKPARLRDGAKLSQIYYCPSLDSIPNKAGVYVFARTYAKLVVPLYVGQTLKLRQRIEQHFKGSVQLMHNLKHADNGRRFVIFARVKFRRGQQKQKVLEIVEKSVMKHALAQGYELLNKQGVKQKVHTIKSKGNRYSEQIAPRTMLAERE